MYGGERCFALPNANGEEVNNELLSGDFDDGTLHACEEPPAITVDEVLFDGVVFVEYLLLLLLLLIS